MVAGFILFWGRVVVAVYQHFIIKIFRHTEVEHILQKTHLYPLPRSYSYHFTVFVLSHICESMYTSTGRFTLFF